MSNAKGIIFALRTLEESADSVFHPVLEESVASAGYDLMGIGLMSHIENKLIFRCIIYIMQGDYKLDSSEARPQMSWIYRTALDHILTDLLTKFP